MSGGPTVWESFRHWVTGVPPLEPLEVLADDPHVRSGVQRAYEQFAQQVQALVTDAREVGVPANPAIKEIGGYHVLRELGRGGMGAVYLAQQDQGPLVVIKVPFTEFGTSEQYIEIFFREFQALSTVKHDNIVRVFRFGKDPTHLVFYYVAEFVHGVTLKQFVDARADRPLSSLEAAVVGLAVLRALRVLRDRKITHRDLKPGNVMISRKGDVKLIDFGAAKIGGQASELTNAGVMLGTFDYMAPEAGLRGAGPGGVERDLFALGVMLYRLVKGRLPNDFGAGQDASLAFARFADSNSRVLKDVRGLDPVMKHVLLRMTERDPGKRLVDFDQIECRLAQVIRLAAG